MADPKKRVFSKTVNGEVVTQVTRSPADAVRYVFDGWREVTDEVAEAAKVAKEASAKAAPAAKK